MGQAQSRRLVENYQVTPRKHNPAFRHTNGDAEFGDASDGTTREKTEEDERGKLVVDTPEFRCRLPNYGNQIAKLYLEKLERRHQIQSQEKMRELREWQAKQRSDKTKFSSQ